MITKGLISLILIFQVGLFMVISQNGNYESSYMIDEVLKTDDPIQAILKLDSILNDISNYGENLEVLSMAEQVVLFVGNLEREVNNGGFHQFFLNSSGDHCRETLEALKTIGAMKTHEIVENAYKEWPNENIPAIRTQRLNVLEKIEDQAEENWNACDRQFYNYEENISLLIMNYVKENLSEFK